MNNYFTYEINERNLRIQLKEFVLPLKEDAWQKFEAFADTMVSHHSESRIKNFNFNLNRNIVLPVIFGAIIILFSFLLVNFISIKNPKKENDQKEEVKTAALAKPAPQESADQITTPKLQPEIKQEVTTNDATLKMADPKIPEEKPAITSNSANNKIEPAQVNQPTVSPESSPENIANTGEAKPEAPVKKKSKRRSSEVVESEQLIDIRPTLVSEERDSEIRPN
jgi:hypothetical protein